MEKVEVLGRYQLRELDCQVAERIFGQEVCRRTGAGSIGSTLSANLLIAGEELAVVPFYTLDADADYLVLKKVREDSVANAAKVSEELYRIWSERRVATMERSLSWNDALMYQPGDYSRAALAALQGASES